MSQHSVSFWTQLDTLLHLNAAGDQSALQKLFDQLLAELEASDPAVSSNRRAILEELAVSLDLTTSVSGAAEAAVDAAKLPKILDVEPVHGVMLDALDPAAADGISLVTCCMNRNDNLLKALRTWLPCKEINEIIIVDWSSDTPVSEELKLAGIQDPRVRVLRIDGEPRWILTYAFNIGFRLARYSKILKVDADIELSRSFFRRNRLKSGEFIAGNWRNAEKGQEHVNGFFYCHRTDLAKAGGFNEYITTYGWDDDDLYGRLELNGARRKDVDVRCIRHLDHSDDERAQPAARVNGLAGPTALASFTSDMLYKIRRNRFIANVMPIWTAECFAVPVQLDSASQPAALRGVRQDWVPSFVADHIQTDADYYALAELASWNLPGPIRQVSRENLLLLLDQPKEYITNLEVQLSLSDRPEACRTGKRGYWVIDLSDDILDEVNGGDVSKDLEKIIAYCHEMDLCPVLRADRAVRPDFASETLQQAPYLPSWDDISPCSEFGINDLERVSHNSERRQRISLTLASLGDVASQLAVPPIEVAPSPVSVGEGHPWSNISSPMIAVPRPKLFIDGQHGLGNRLRAIGSGAALAEASDRELVIVWEPDHHCEGHFSDLFEYDGAVEEKAFVDDAAKNGGRVYNYMEVEDGGEKDAPIDLSGSADIYARSAYVLKSEVSDWNSENVFLHGLRPVEAVRALTDSVRRTNDVSAHVRMTGGRGYEHLAYESADNWTEEGHLETEKWRQRSHFSHFIKRLDALRAEGRADRIFLAADEAETYEVFQACYGDSLAFLPRELYDRSAEQLQYALADAMLLGSSPLLLGSTWSSFSELAMRLSPEPMTIEMSGRDF